MQKIALILIAIFLSSCGLIQDRSAEYVQSSKGKVITIPEGLDDRKVTPGYYIPEVEFDSRLSNSYELPKPPSTSSSRGGIPFEIEEADKQRWLSVQMAPGRLWPLVEFFLSENKISIKDENISKGILITDVIPEDIHPSDSSGTESHIMIKLAQGVRRNTSEIFLRLVSPSPVSDDSVWRNAGMLDAESDLLNKIGKFVTSDEQQNRQSMLANDISSKPKVFLVNNESDSYIKFELSYERTWKAVGKALESSGVVVSDLNHSEGLYYVSYLDEDSVSSWFDTQNSIKEKRKQLNFKVQIEERTVDDQLRFIVIVQTISDKFSDEEANQLLELIYENVS